MHVLYITLGGPREAACLARLRRLQAEAGESAVDLVRVAGVDGDTLDREALRAAGRYRPLNRWNELTTGQLGCFLAHKRAWAVAARLEGPVVILEDDADLRAGTLRAALALEGRADVLWLGRDMRLVRAQRAAAGLSTEDPPGRPTEPIGLRRTWGLFAYMPSPAFLRRMCACDPPMRVAVDLHVSTCRAFPDQLALLQHAAGRVPTAESLTERNVPQV
jgi:hypothetical protein